jgi:hypothetical protein
MKAPLYRDGLEQQKQNQEQATAKAKYRGSSLRSE